MTQKVVAWTEITCRSCERPRLHFRTKTLIKWTCIGRAKWRVASQHCGPKEDNDA